MSKKYDVIVIGAGIGGLTCGNFLAKNGLKVLILEKNPVPGGAVTTFYRGGHPIDISHSLCGMGEGGFIRRIFDYLEIYKEFDCSRLEKSFIYIPDRKRRPIFCYANIEKYKEELQKYFPDEKNSIDLLFKKMEHIWNKEALRCHYNPSLLRFLATYPFLFSNLFRYRSYTFEQFLSKFIKTPLLKEVVSMSWPYLGLDRFSVSALYMICIIIAYHKEGSFFIKGGFGKISKVLASNFQNLGGSILYNKKVQEILLTDRNKAYGVKDADNHIYYGDRIVSNTDSKKTFLDLTKRYKLPKKFIKKISKLEESSSALQISLIIQGDIDKDFLSSGSIMYPSTAIIERRMRKILKFGKKTNAKSIITISINNLQEFIFTDSKDAYAINMVYLPASYSLWKNFLERYGREEYERAKGGIAELAANEIRRYFSIRKILSSHVFTPLSFEKWLNSTNGAIYDLAALPQQSLFDRLKNKTYIDNLYLVGAKTFPGAGIAGALCSGLFLSDTLLGGRLTKGKLTLRRGGLIG